MRRKLLMIMLTSLLFTANKTTISEGAVNHSQYAGMSTTTFEYIAQAKGRDLPKEEPIVEVETAEVEPVTESTPEPVVIEEDTIDYGDLILLGLVTMAEAEGESEYGKRLVIDTILNRVDSEHFPNSISGVVYEKNQFTSMWNGRINEVVATDEVCKLVRQEYNCRTNSTVMFFTAGHYGDFGTPLFSEGNHYFSSYN